MFIQLKSEAESKASCGKLWIGSLRVQYWDYPVVKNFSGANRLYTRGKKDNSSSQPKVRKGIDLPKDKPSRKQHLNIPR